MMNLKKILLVGALAISSAAQATTINFDENVITTYVGMTNGYGGLNWSNFLYGTPSMLTAPNGYKRAMVSGNNYIFNSGGYAAGFGKADEFTFNSGYFTSAWNDGLKVIATGSLNGNLLYQKEFFLNTTGPTLETFNWAGVNSVRFASYGGTPQYTDFGGGSHFTIDDLTIDAVAIPEIPEPGSLALLGLGLAGFAVARRRKTAA